MADKGEPICSPIAADKGEQLRSPFGADKGEQIATKGELACSPDPYRSNSDPNTSADAAAAGDHQKAVAAYHNAISVSTPIVEEEIKAELSRSPREWVLRALEIAAMRNHRRCVYVAGILRRWHADGYDGDMDTRAGRAPGAARTCSKSMGYGWQSGRRAHVPRGLDNWVSLTIETRNRRSAQIVQMSPTYESGTL